MSRPPSRPSRNMSRALDNHLLDDEKGESADLIWKTSSFSARCTTSFCNFSLLWLGRLTRGQLGAPTPTHQIRQTFCMVPLGCPILCPMWGVKRQRRLAYHWRIKHAHRANRNLSRGLGSYLVGGLWNHRRQRLGKFLIGTESICFALLRECSRTRAVQWITQQKTGPENHVGQHEQPSTGIRI